MVAPRGPAANADEFRHLAVDGGLVKVIHKRLHVERVFQVGRILGNDVRHSSPGVDGPRAADLDAAGTLTAKHSAEPPRLQAAPVRAQSLDIPMKLASYKVRGRESFGVVVGEGVVDLKLRLGPRYETALDLLREDGGLDKARRPPWACERIIRSARSNGCRHCRRPRKFCALASIMRIAMPTMATRRSPSTRACSTARPIRWSAISRPSCGRTNPSNSTMKVRSRW